MYHLYVFVISKQYTCVTNKYQNVVDLNLLKCVLALTWTICVLFSQSWSLEIRPRWKKKTVMLKMIFLCESWCMPSENSEMVLKKEKNAK